MSESKKTIIESLNDYFKTCPFLKDGIISAEYIGGEDVKYSINAQNIADPVIENYIDGSSKRQYAFTFNSNELYGPDAIDQFNAYKFYEDLQEWIEDNNWKYIYPNVEGAEEMKILSQGYIYSEDQYSAIYQIQLRLIYKKKGRILDGN